MTPETNLFSVSCLGKVAEHCGALRAKAVYSFLNPDVPARHLPSFATGIRHDTYFLFDQERGRYEPQILEQMDRFMDELEHTQPLTAYPHTIFHCHGGVSRSTAACYVAAAMAYGPGQEEAAFHRLLEITNKPWPNLRMVEHADTRLRREGRLIQPLLAYRRLHPHRLAAYKRMNATRGFLSSVIRDESLEQVAATKQAPGRSN